MPVKIKVNLMTELIVIKVQARTRNRPIISLRKFIIRKLEQKIKASLTCLQVTRRMRTVKI